MSAGSALSERRAAAQHTLGRRSRGGGLARGAAYNLIGQAAPLVVAYFAIPVLTRELGAARFGLLTLAWAVLGYFSLFDLGLGRALTHGVAERLSDHRDEEIPPLVWTGLALMLLFGVVGAGAAVFLAPWLVGRAFELPAELQVEALGAGLVLALSIPVVIVSAAIRGVLEATQRFDLVNAVRVPQGIFSFAGPVLVLPFSRSLAAITAVLLVGRLAATIALYWLMLRELPSLGRVPRVQRAAAATLLRFGSWMTVSNVVGPLMVTLDRFVIAATAGAAAVAYYTAPWEAVTKLWMIPAALSGVLFPAFATAQTATPERTRALYVRGVKLTVLAVLPLAAVVYGFADVGLAAWLGPDYAAHSTAVLRWLTAGLLLNCIAQIPFALIQGAGRPDITAKLHLAELPVYVAALWWLTRTYGITGAAVAWTLRAALDAAALLMFAQQLAPVGRRTAARAAVVIATGGAAACALAAAPLLVASKIAVALSLLACGAAAAWVVVLSGADRDRVRALAVRADARARSRRRAVGSP